MDQHGQESFKFSQPLKDVLQKTRTGLQQTLSSPAAGDLCLGKRQQAQYEGQKSNSDARVEQLEREKRALQDEVNEERKNIQKVEKERQDLREALKLSESKVHQQQGGSFSSNPVLNSAVSKTTSQLDILRRQQQLLQSDQNNQNSQEENKRLQQQLSDSQHGHTAHVHVEQLERQIRELQDEATEGRKNIQKVEKERQDLCEALKLSESKVHQQQIAKERAWADLHTQMAATKRLIAGHSAAVEMAQQELQHLTERVRDLEMLSRKFHPLLPSTEMVETFLHHIPFLGDYCLLVSHLEGCSSCRQVMPLWCDVRTCDKVCCEKCEILVNLYIGHLAHCQETDCKVPYCIHCKTLSQQLNLSTQDLATDQQFRKEVQSCLQRVIPQANEIDGVLLHHPGERDLYHRRQMTPALQMLLRFFASHVRPVQELVVWCFRHHKEWSSLSHEKYCPACRIFQHILRRCGTCRTDMCETCVMACCACAKHTLVCHNESCTFLFCHTLFKTSVRHRDTTSPSRVLLTLFRECVHQICYET